MNLPEEAARVLDQLTMKNSVQISPGGSQQPYARIMGIRVPWYLVLVADLTNHPWRTRTCHAETWCFMTG
eukprot:gene18035-biopygen611